MHPLRIRLAVPRPPVLGSPVATRIPVDPHAAVGRLVEAFEDCLVVTKATKEGRCSQE